MNFELKKGPTQKATCCRLRLPMSIRVVDDPLRDCGMDGNALERIALWQERLVAEGRLPMAMTLVSRFGKPAFFRASGFANVETKEPVREDHLFRLYSMTKPLVAIGLLILYEEGRFQVMHKSIVIVR